jgi:hypothetical protein
LGEGVHTVIEGRGDNVMEPYISLEIYEELGWMFELGIGTGDTS